MATVKQVKNWQRENELSDEEVAKALGVSRQWWNRLKRGGSYGTDVASRLRFFVPSTVKAKASRRWAWKLRAFAGSCGLPV